MLSVNLVAHLKLKFSRKAVVVACFAPRILVVGAALARVIYLFPITPHNDPQFKLWAPAVISQLQVCLSISTACIPYMKPFFEGVEAGVWRADDLRRSKSGYGYGPRSGFRKGHRSAKQISSMDSTAATSLKFGRTPDQSPRIPSPAPLSPLTPPMYTMPPNSSASHSRSPSERGLKLHIPPTATHATPATDITSPKTASSHALSPQYLSPLSPLPLLSQHVASPTREPTPPPRAHSPRPPIPSSHYGTPNTSPDPNLMSPPRSPNFSLFPAPTSGRYSHVPLKKATPPLPTDSAAKQAAAYRIAANISAPRNSPFPPRKSSMQQRAHSPARRPTVKFATTPKPSTPSPSITIPSYYTKTPTTAGTITPSIPSYYMRTPPSIYSENSLVPEPLSPQKKRNHRVLIPINSSRTEQVGPSSPLEPRTPLTFWRVSLEAETPAQTPAETPYPVSASSMMRANKPWEMDEMPVIQDKRSSPRIVLQRQAS